MPQSLSWYLFSWWLLQVRFHPPLTSTSSTVWGMEDRAFCLHLSVWSEHCCTLESPLYGHRYFVYIYIYIYIYITALKARFTGPVGSSIIESSILLVASLAVMRLMSGSWSWSPPKAAQSAWSKLHACRRRSIPPHATGSWFWSYNRHNPCDFLLACMTRS